MSASPNLASAALAGAIERLLATTLAADALGMDRFAAMAGKRIRFACLLPAFEHTWIIDSGQILISAADDAGADVTVTGNLYPLLLVLARPDLEPAASLQVAGDVALLTELRATLATLQPDFAPLLEPLIGREAAAGADAVANASARTLRELADLAVEQLGAVSDRLAAADAAGPAGRLGAALRDLAEQFAGRGRDRKPGE